MPEGGEVRITSGSSKGLVELNFSDTGAGIKDEVIQKLWKEPVTTKAKGLGLGLAISKRIIEAHGGTIAAMQRSDGQGTVVKVMLPINHDLESV
jgi:signal transduction histidine kinase